MTTKTKHHFGVWGILFLLLLLTVLLWYVYFCGTVGSSTEHGAVYQTKFLGRTCYQWYIFGTDGSVIDYGFTTNKPHISEDNGRVDLVLYEEIDDSFVNITNYFLDTGTVDHAIYEHSEQFSEGRLKLGRNKGVPVESGSSYAEVVDFTLHDMPFYCWCVRNTDDEILWGGTSTVLPEITEVPAPPEASLCLEIVSVYYTEDGTDSCQVFYPRESDFSHAYSVYEDRTVYAEHLTDTFLWNTLAYDESLARTDDFVNVYRDKEIITIDDAYLRAKNEVTIPYSLVTFRIDTNADFEIICWEVTFSQKDNAEGQIQTVYMDKYGVTQLILDGRPLS